MTPEYLAQLETIRDAIAADADIYGLWGIIYAIDDVLRQYGRFPKWPVLQDRR